MIEINIAKDFGVETGARTYEDGNKSGQEFFEKMLKPKFQEAIDKGDQLKIILDGTDGMATSFLNEAFRRLGSEFGAQLVLSKLILVSVEIPKYIDKVKASINEKSK